MDRSKKKIGFLTTWNQKCGLSTFARFLTDQFDPHEKIIFAEDTKEQIPHNDEPWVERCWSLASAGLPSDSYTRLENAMAKHQVDILHLNYQSPKFFKFPEFQKTLLRIRASGVKLVAHVHSVFTLENGHKILGELSDKILVHNVQTKLELCAHGISSEKISVIQHGVVEQSAHGSDIRSQLKIDSATKLIFSAGFLQPHKGVEAVLDTVLHLIQKNIPAHGLIVGAESKEDPGSTPYHEALQAYARDNGIQDKITFLSSYVSDEALLGYMSSADLIILNYRSAHFEGSGIGSLAAGSGVPVIASTAPAFSGFGDAFFKLTPGFPAGLAAELILTNESLRSQLVANAQEYAKRFSWNEIAKIVKGYYAELLDHDAMEKDMTTTTNSKRLKVLMQNRGSTFSHRGGDTVLMERLQKGLQARGVDVTIDVDCAKEPKDFDLVHLFNFALPDMIRVLGQRAQAAGVPFVVSTLAEDVPNFHQQSQMFRQTLQAYKQNGQDRSWWAAHRSDWKSATPCPQFDNEWVTRNAAQLFTNGQAESEVIKQTYPWAKNTKEIKLGFEVGSEQSADAFVSTYGVKDFVLCVGRLESRKNQLGLLKALEDSDLTVVLAAGGFSYQPDYEQAVNSFKRKGQTLVLGRLTPELLSSAYAACKVHVLSSWYELPGLVTLEAAARGKNVVATRNGTMPDYLGELPFYCEAGDVDSIKNAVHAAYYAPVAPELAQRASSYSWDTTVNQTLSAYDAIVPMSMTAPINVATPSIKNFSLPVYDGAEGVTRFQELVEKGELAAKRIDFASAHQFLEQAEALNPHSPRVLKALGATLLAEGKLEKSTEYFDRALVIAPQDEKVLSGRGMCAMLAKNFAGAFDYFDKALSINPDHVVSLNQFAECCGELGKPERAEALLRRYVSRNEKDINIRFDLARCLRSQGKYAEADAQAKIILESEPSHDGAKTLVAPVEAPVVTVAALTPPAPTAVSWKLSSSEEPRVVEIEEFKKKREFKEAEAAIQKLRTQGVMSAALSACVGCIEAELRSLEGKLEEGDKLFSAVIEAFPNHPRALCGKGALAAEAGQWESARGYFDTVQELDPSNDVSVAGQAICESQMDNNERAWQLFQKAIKLNPENQRAVLGIIQLGYPRRDFSEIESTLKGYLEYHPVSLDMQYALAGVFFAQKRVKEAHSELEKILVFNPAHERALELRDIIAKQDASAPSYQGGYQSQRLN